MKMGNPLSVSTNTYHGFTLDEALAGIAEAGFKYVELTAVRGYTEHVDWKMSADEIRTVKEKLRSYGLTPVGLSGHSNLLEEDGLQNFLKNMELAAELGCGYVVTSTGEAHGDTAEEKDEESLRKALKTIEEKCRALGVKATVETHGNAYGAGERLLKLLGDFDPDLVGINYDTANVIFYGNVRPEEDLAKCVQRVNYMHLKDKAGKQAEWNFPAIGKGDIDFKQLFRILEGNGYRGPLSVEIEFTPDGPGSLAEVNKAVKESFAYLERL